MVLNPLGRTTIGTGDVTEAPSRSGMGPATSVRPRRGAVSEAPSSDQDIAYQLARLRNLIAADQIDHNARRGTYLDILL
jgi:hypothetical protein